MISPPSRRLKIAFIHPDLGLGGAERLILDAALSLQTLGHSPTIFTLHQDPARTFPEAAPSSPQLPIRIIPAPLPRNLFGRLHAILAAIRCAFLALYVCLFHTFDVAIVDIVAFPLLIFALFRKPVLFYCHFPDALLAPPSSGFSSLYRFVVDAVEAFSIRRASVIVCNSRFTSTVFSRTFPQFPPPKVIYPCVAIPPVWKRNPQPVLLSLNRYERKKNISLAIDSLSELHCLHPNANHIRLIIAGGYDPRLLENVQHFDELQHRIKEKGLESSVTLMKNVTDETRRTLLQSALAVLYTPSNEHFGIVPLEAMAEGVPVVAVNSGGPVESVEQGITGILCEPTPVAFSRAVLPFVVDKSASLEMGHRGRERVEAYFSRDVLGKELQNVLVKLLDS